jgi:predicted amidohydrolase
VNLGVAETSIRKAARLGVRVVALPEVFNWRGERHHEHGAAEPIPGPTSNLISHLARELEVYILAGSILEEISQQTRVHNTSLLFDPAGKLLARYRKVHLFDVAISQGVSVLESDTRASGDAAVVADTRICPMGLSICYDLRFPELYRTLVTRGAKVIFVPSAFTAITGKAHWEPLLRARAIENQVYIIAPNQYGKSSNNFTTYGNSMIVDPWGRIVARASDGPEIVCGEIDLDYLDLVRAELPALSHRKFV